MNIHEYQAKQLLARYGVAVPRGVAFHDWSRVRSSSMYLRIHGSDWWGIDHYCLLGYFQELRLLGGDGAVFQQLDHGWLLMAASDGDVDMSEDDAEGDTYHQLELNGTFECRNGLVVPSDLVSLRSSTERVKVSGTKR